MPKSQKKQDGFVLIVALVLLAVVSLLAANGMGVTTMNERMAGNYSDRGRAQSAAEQALTQAQAFLATHADTCLAAGCVTATLAGTGLEKNTASLPSTWPPELADSVEVPLAASGADASARYLINWLSDASFTGGAFSTCKAYSIMGRGQGKDDNTVVLLQTVAYVCPAA